jgi:hypothetical protein
VTLDAARGLLVETKQSVDQTVNEFAGPGSSYSVKTLYTEKLVEELTDQRK